VHAWIDEVKFMHFVDTEANYALQKIIADSAAASGQPIRLVAAFLRTFAHEKSRSVPLYRWPASGRRLLFSSGAWAPPERIARVFQVVGVVVPVGPF
jgi:hypothetical protein